MTDDPTSRPPAGDAPGTGSSEPPPDVGDRPDPVTESPWTWAAPGDRTEEQPVTGPEDSATVSSPSPPTVPAPAWLGGAMPAAPVAAPTPRRRPVLTAAIAGAVVGALVAGILVTVLRDERPIATGPTVTFSSNTSKIVRPADIQSILARVQPAVVAIRTRTLSLGDFLRPVPGQGAGTGFVISEDGVIVTNNHVVAGAQSIEVVFGNDRKMPARVLGRDPTADLAVLRVDASGLTPAVLGNSDELRVGDDVVAIGNALALEGGPTVTRGIVSAQNRTIVAENGVRLEHVIQTDTAINPGNSGGPLVNSSGEVVGINTAVAGDAQNIGFSIAITQAKPIIEELRQGTRPFLGVNMFEVTPDVAQELDLKVDKGALVVEVTEGSGAEVGGIRPHDVIVEIDGKTIEDPGDVSDAVRGHKPGDELKVTVVRDGDRQTLDVRLGERPADVG